MDTLTPADTELHSIDTEIFARYVGDRIASQRGKAAIADVFRAVLRERNVEVESPERLAAWANCTSKLILEDDRHDDETAMAARAVRLVLKQYFGDSLLISGEPVSGEPSSEETSTF